MESKIKELPVYLEKIEALLETGKTHFTTAYAFTLFADAVAYELQNFCNYLYYIYPSDLPYPTNYLSIKHCLQDLELDWEKHILFFNSYERCVIHGLEIHKHWSEEGLLETREHKFTKQLDFFGGIELKHKNYVGNIDLLISKGEVGSADFNGYNYYLRSKDDGMLEEAIIEEINPNGNQGTFAITCRSISCRLIKLRNITLRPDHDDYILNEMYTTIHAFMSYVTNDWKNNIIGVYEDVFKSDKIMKLLKKEFKDKPYNKIVFLSIIGFFRNEGLYDNENKLTDNICNEIVGDGNMGKNYCNPYNGNERVKKEGIKDDLVTILNKYRSIKQ